MGESEDSIRIEKKNLHHPHHFRFHFHFHFHLPRPPIYLVCCVLKSDNATVLNKLRAHSRMDVNSLRRLHLNLFHQLTARFSAPT